MKKFLVLFLTLSLILLAACGAPAEEEAAPEDTAAADAAETEDGTITIVDHNDNTVVLPADIQRIAVCDILPLPSVLAIFFNSADKIVGMTDTSMSAAANSLLGELYPEILNAQTDYIKGTEVNVESLSALDPDVVFYSASSPQLGEQLTNAGFNAVAVSASKWDYDAIETLNQWISLLGQMFPEDDKSDLVAARSQEVYDMVQERVKDIPDEERERLFFLFKYSDAAIITSGAHFFGQWWADAVGAVNVGQDLEVDNAVETSLEQVYAWDPSLMLITNFTSAQPEDIYNNTIGVFDWSGVKAVQDKKVYKMPLGMYRSYTCGVDTPMTLLWLAQTVYPDLFSDIDLTEEVKAYYLDVFGVELTDEQADSIFTPPSSAAAGF
ncbi:MAG: ABC transporter substrate-binding protein [Firmicutes bacterium]|nr:ABC transporter substrate-binding protein [Bacillota bacterium]